jgi:hypothetical protein
MKQAHVDQKAPVAPLRPRRILRWLDSLAWLAIAGALTAMLLPAQSQHTVSKRSGGETQPTTASQQSMPRPLHAQDDTRHFPSGHEFVLQNEADFIRAQNAPPPPGAEVGLRPGQKAEEQNDQSPRVTSGPALNGPQLGSPAPR